MHVNFTLEIRFVTQKNMSENGNGPEASDRVKDLEKGSLESILPGQRFPKSAAGKCEIAQNARTASLWARASADLTLLMLLARAPGK